jgi:hypothetical protein
MLSSSSQRLHLKRRPKNYLAMDRGPRGVPLTVIGWFAVGRVGKRGSGPAGRPYAGALEVTGRCSRRCLVAHIGRRGEFTWTGARFRNFRSAFPDTSTDEIMSTGIRPRIFLKMIIE